MSRGLGDVYKRQDDMSCYDRIQEAAEAGTIDWIDLHRHHGREVPDCERLTAIGTSDLALRNQYFAWLDFMTGEESGGVP